GATGDYLFCFWNVENMFDDQKDKRNRIDEKYDSEFADHPELLSAKLGNLSKVLLSMNDGRGPDILAMAELESERSLELIRNQLTKACGKKAPPSEQALLKPVSAGRHIAPGILTRLPVVGDRTQKLGKNHHRILEGHINVNGHDLVVIASH